MWRTTDLQARGWHVHTQRHSEQLLVCSHCRRNQQQPSCLSLLLLLPPLLPLLTRSAQHGAGMLVPCPPAAMRAGCAALPHRAACAADGRQWIWWNNREQKDKVAAQAVGCICTHAWCGIFLRIPPPLTCTACCRRPRPLPARHRHPGWRSPDKRRSALPQPPPGQAGLPAAALAGPTTPAALPPPVGLPTGSSSGLEPPVHAAQQGPAAPTSAAHRLAS